MMPSKQKKEHYEPPEIPEPPLKSDPETYYKEKGELLIALTKYSTKLLYDSKTLDYVDLNVALMELQQMIMQVEIEQRLKKGHQPPITGIEVA